MSIPKESVTKEDLHALKEEIVHQFHIVSEGLLDQIELLGEGHAGIINRLGTIDERLERIEKRTNVSI